MYAASTARFGLLHTARLVAENELRKTESHSPAQVVRVEGERDRVLQERWPRRAEVGFYGTQQLVRSDVAGWGVIRKWWYSRCLRNWLLDLDVERRILYFFQECLKWFGVFFLNRRTGTCNWTEVPFLSEANRSVGGCRVREEAHVAAQHWGGGGRKHLEQRNSSNGWRSTADHHQNQASDG